MFLLLVLVRNPIAFLRALFLDFSFGHPKWAYAQYIRKHIDLAQESARHLLHIEDTSRRGFLDGWYAAAHGIARLELYCAGREYALKGNAGRYAWRKVFGPISAGQQQLHELAAVTNKTTGFLSLRALLVSRSQEQVESALIVPRYLRCLLGLVADALQGGARGNEGRRLMASLTVAGGVIYLLLAV